MGVGAVSDRVQLKVWVDEETRDALERFVIQTHGQKRGHVSETVEDAVLEYIDRDRLKRVDDKLDRVLARLDEIDGTHTHKQSETVEKAERIGERLAQIDRTMLPEDRVRRAIEDVAGGDDRTVRKYEEQLKRRGLAYEHPTSDTWTVDREVWGRWATNYVKNNPTVETADVIRPYPLDFDEFGELMEVVEA